MHRVRHLLALVAVCAVVVTAMPDFTVAPVATNPEAPHTIGRVVADTEHGPVRGKLTSAGKEWIGIRYAAAPTGELRYSAPQKPTSWVEPVDADNWAPGCPQHCNLPLGLCPPTFSEDCLFLNVFSPETSVEPSGELLPVLFWIHGGKFESGAGGCELFHGSRLANLGNMVVVTINYRLGVLGFLKTRHTSGNMGLQDQRLALEWVRDNIANFGGDKNRVTIAGESAGGTSVASHMISPLSKGLFHGAILESNPFTLRLKTEKRGINVGDAYARALGCKIDDVACMRKASLDEVYHAQNKAQSEVYVLHPFDSVMNWVPVIDGHELLGQPLQSMQANKYNQVPLMVGTCQEEGVEFIYNNKDEPISPIEYVVGVEAVYRKHASEVLKLYPSKPDSRYVASEVVTDHLFGCPSRASAAAVHKDKHKAFLFRFNETISFPGWGNLGFCKGHSCHGVELPFVFNTVDRAGPWHFTDKEEKLSLMLGGYWANFVTSGDPNTGPIKMPVQWPEYDAATDLLMNFHAPSGASQAQVNKAKCDMFDKIGYENDF